MGSATGGVLSTVKRLLIVCALVQLVSGCLERPDLSLSGWSCADDTDCATDAVCVYGTCFTTDTTPCFTINAPECDDGLPCTADACDLNRNQCVHSRLPGSCALDATSCGCSGLDDRERCIIGVCDPLLGCIERPMPAGAACGPTGVDALCGDDGFSGRLCDGTIDSCTSVSEASCADYAAAENYAMCMSDVGCATLPTPNYEAVEGTWYRVQWDMRDGVPLVKSNFLVALEDIGDGISTITQRLGSGGVSVFTEPVLVDALGRLGHSWDMDGEPRWVVMDGSLRFGSTFDIQTGQSRVLFRLPIEMLTAKMLAGAWRGYLTRQYPYQGGQTEVSALTMDIGIDGEVQRATLTDIADPTSVHARFVGGEIDIRGGRTVLIWLQPEVNKPPLVLEVSLSRDGRMLGGIAAQSDERIGVVMAFDANAATGPISFDGRYTIAVNGPSPLLDDHTGVPNSAYMKSHSVWVDVDMSTGAAVASTNVSGTTTCHQTTVDLDVDPAARTLQLTFERDGWTERFAGHFLSGNPVVPRVPAAIIAPVGAPTPSDGASVENFHVFRAGVGWMLWTPLQAPPACPPDAAAPDD